ncbi:hypothetical protein GDO81_001013 [Engystomops pustulosus]|uniref:Uncharacterized protein n=1 Tax=Engystomops pustulosus TaxID=76066 RepID=A0AAV7D946_ENGPU|nr:hypothetical protein GDO81_001013 [Engystomops pustulosus]
MQPALIALGFSISPSLSRTFCKYKQRLCGINPGPGGAQRTPTIQTESTLYPFQALYVHFQFLLPWTYTTLNDCIKHLHNVN